MRSLLATADLRVLFAARLLRMFAYGMLGLTLVLYLSVLKLTGSEIGLLLTLTLLGDVVLSLWLAAHADRWGRRKALIVGAALMALGGLGMAATERFSILVLAATIGVISPTGGEMGPFLSIEQACLAQSVSDRERTRVFAWYNLAGYLATAIGALVTGWFTASMVRGGWASVETYRAVLYSYAFIGAILAVLSSRLSRSVEVSPRDGTTPPVPILLGLGESRPIVMRLSALFALDSFGGGFIVQSFLAWWFQQRFGASGDTLGLVFFGTNLLSGVSGLVAVSLARRFGLIATMVWTHLPSNLLLMLVPLMPTWALAVTVLLLRHLLSQMDVPTRQSYVNAIVPAHERSAANGMTTTAKQLGTAFGPVVAGSVLGAAAGTGLPFFICGILKSTYDLMLWRAFRTMKPPEER